MGSTTKVSTPAAPPPPSNVTNYTTSIPERDYYAETADTLQAQVDLAPELLAAEQKFRPQYGQLDYDMYKRFLPQYMQLGVDTAPLTVERSRILTEGERSGDMADLLKFGPQITDAYRTANPEAAALMDELNKQAMTELQAGSKLTADERRGVVQNSRAAFADRGLAMSNPAMLAEVMNLDSYGRERQATRRGFAHDVLGLNKSIYGDPVTAILGRPSSNLSFSANTANVPASMQTGAQLFNPESGYASSLYGQNASNALQGGMFNAGQANNMAQFNAGQQSDYFSMLYNAQLNSNIATSNNNAALYGAALGAGGQAGSGAMMAMALCWVAREVYGAENPMWRVFRQWLLTMAPRWFRELYRTCGPSAALALRMAPMLKPMVRRWMDNKIGEMGHDLSFAVAG